VLRSGSPLPSFEGATRWLNHAASPDELRGRPVFVQFWARSCYICKENMPVVQQWQSTYGARGVAFVSVHMPRQESDTSVEDVAATARTFGMREPLAIDNEHVIGNRFETDGLWPIYFVFDADGKLRGRAAGAASLSILESTLERVAPAHPMPA
jgi:thiol-disulfide isomerase/thioredoxin